MRRWDVAAGGGGGGAAGESDRRGAAALGSRSARGTWRATGGPFAPATAGRFAGVAGARAHRRWPARAVGLRMVGSLSSDDDDRATAATVPRRSCRSDRRVVPSTAAARDGRCATRPAGGCRATVRSLPPESDGRSTENSLSFQDAWLPSRARAGGDPAGSARAGRTAASEGGGVGVGGLGRCWDRLTWGFARGIPTRCRARGPSHPRRQKSPPSSPIPSSISSPPHSPRLPTPVPSTRRTPRRGSV